MEQKLEVIQSEYKQLSDIEHCRIRSEMYTGSRVRTELAKYLLHSDGKVYPETVSTVPAALLLANELLCNSFDEAVRTRKSDNTRNWQITVIDVIVDLQRTTLTVRDNGGISVAIDSATNMLIPTMLFGHLRTGSNYTDDRGDVGGQNGLGAVLVNIFSKTFHVRTGDGKHLFQQTWHNNLSETIEANVVDSTEHFTEIIAEFDTNYDRTKLGADVYDMTWARCIEARCMEIAAQAAGWEQSLTVNFTCKHADGEWSNSFKFARFDDYLRLWPNCERFVIDKNYRFNVAMGLSNGAQESSAIVNALQAPWGTHVDAFVDACVWHIRAHINNKFKVDVKPAKIKSYIKMVSTWQINAATFSGQTKEVLVSDVKNFGMPVIPSEQFIKKLLRSEIVTTIVEEMHARIAEQRKAEIAQQQKEIDRRTKRNILPQKLTDAANASKGKYCRLYVVEGDSAATGLRRFRKAEIDGIFALFGKSCGNMLYADEFRVLANRALSALCQSIGFSFNGGQRMRYEHIVITCDQDYDGYSICGLLLTFFNKFMPELIEQGRLFRLATPIMTCTNLKTKELVHYYNLDEFEADKAKYRGKQWEVHYCKGLASLSDQDYAKVMKEPRLIRIVKDDLADASLTAWFGNDSSKRKELMQMSDVIDDSFLADLYDNDDDEQDEQ